MAHFAKLDDNGIVTAVHVVNNSVITVNGEESEAAGIAFLSNLHGHDKWVQTSYNSNFRKNYAGIGFTYDQGRDAFVPPRPFVSWILDEQTCQWFPPAAYPQDGKMYVWDEPTTSWEEIAE